MEGRNNSDVARAAGVDHSLISRWRRGDTPTRLQESTRKKLERVVGGAQESGRVAAGGDPELRSYVLSTLRMLQRQAQAIVDNAAEAQRVLGGELSGPSSPYVSVGEAEEAEAILDQLPPLPKPKSESKRRRA